MRDDWLLLRCVRGNTLSASLSGRIPDVSDAGLRRLLATKSKLFFPVPAQRGFRQGKCCWPRGGTVNTKSKNALKIGNCQAGKSIPDPYGQRPGLQIGQ